MITTIDFCGVKFKNPVITASGTFGFGQEYGRFYDLSLLGGVCAKGLTLEQRSGNKPPRIAETPSGILNSVGLQNPGVHSFIQHDLPLLKKYDTVVIANIAGNTIEEYCEMARILDRTNVDIIEVNISCPNVKQGGVSFGSSSDIAGRVTKKVRRATTKPLVVKLSPNVTDIRKIASAVEANGADGISLINTLLGMLVDINTRQPVLASNVGGLSGPAVRPVAVRMVWQASLAVSIPIIGMGGIATGEDAVEFMLCGASLVSIGTQNFIDPYAPLKVIDGITKYCNEHNLAHVKDIIGKVELN